MHTMLSELQIDALKEVSSIGAGNAATALSQMIKKRIVINVPQVQFSTIDEATRVFGPAETIVSAVCLRVLGDVTGIILITFGKAEATRLSCLLMGRQTADQEGDWDEIGLSAIKEVATILAGSYLNALSKMLELQFNLSLPSFAQDMAGALIQNVLIETNQNAEHAIVVNTEMSVVDERVMGYFFFIPEAQSLGKVLEAMGV
ncbi:MAG: hypothetical protein ACD_62C00607G0003 [uncultured bacterium]|nr:MAG: hypothetical protein ACD_62C00607G0003 [uncultured bacterium]